MAAKSHPPSGSSRLPPRGPKPKTPLSLQIARASWQFVGITAVVAGITFTVGQRDPTVRAIAEIIVGGMMAIAIGFGIFGLVAFSREDADDEENELRGPLLKNSLFGFLAVAILLAVAIPVFLNARHHANVRRIAAAAKPTPTAGDSTPAFTPRTQTSGGQVAATATKAPGGPELIAVDEGRTFARSYVTLIQRNLFDEAYKYLPADVRGRVTTKQHENLWQTASGVDREEIVIADATEAAAGRAVEVKVQIPGKSDPQVIVVQKSGEKMWATPRQFVSP